jgi:outer membrane protein assembly factor BamB
VQWARNVGGAVAGAVARVGTLLVAATTNGQVWGLQAGNGKPVWQQFLGEPIFSPATSADPLVFVGSDLGTGFVLEAATGAVVAKYRSGGLVRGPAAVSTPTICFASTDGWLRAISRDGRTPRWGYPLGGPIAVGPCLQGDRIYVGAGGRLLALDAASGRCRRSWKVPDMAGDLVVTTDTLYVGTSAGRIVALVNP